MNKRIMSLFLSIFLLVGQKAVCSGVLQLKSDFVDQTPKIISTEQISKDKYEIFRLRARNDINEMIEAKRIMEEKNTENEEYKKVAYEVLCEDLEDPNADLSFEERVSLDELRKKLAPETFRGCLARRTLSCVGYISSLAVIFSGLDNLVKGYLMLSSKLSQ